MGVAFLGFQGCRAIVGLRSLELLARVWGWCLQQLLLHVSPVQVLLEEENIGADLGGRQPGTHPL